MGAGVVEIVDLGNPPIKIVSDAALCYASTDGKQVIIFAIDIFKSESQETISLLFPVDFLQLGYTVVR